MKFVALSVLFLDLVIAHNTINEAINEYQQDDPLVIDYIKQNLLEPPPMDPEVLDDMNTSSEVHGIEDLASVLVGQYNQPPVIESLFKEGQQRFFIEAGAYDGILGSNTLRLELSDWTGLLVEPNPQLYDKVKLRGRNAWTLGSCFSMEPTPQVVTFDAADQVGGIVNTETGEKPGVDCPKREDLQMQCVPFYSVVQALGNPRIDFLSLDIEGADLQVLMTIPFDKVNISVIMIEVAHLGEIFEGDNDTLRQFLHEHGYIFYRRMSIDDIFVHKSFMTNKAF